MPKRNALRKTWKLGIGESAANFATCKNARINGRARIRADTTRYRAPKEMGELQCTV